MSYWTFSDIFEEAGPPVTPFHGGFGLLTLQSVKKPTYYAYKFLNNLGDTELINKDASSWVCKDKNGNIQALFWDYTLLSPDSSYNQQFYSRIIPSKKLGRVNLDIMNVPNGKYQISVYRTGYKKNDSFTAYKEIGAPKSLSVNQELDIKKASDGTADISEMVEVKGGRLLKTFEMRENDVFFVQFSKVQ